MFVLIMYSYTTRKGIMTSVVCTLDPDQTVLRHRMTRRIL